MLTPPGVTPLGLSKKGGDRIFLYKHSAPIGAKNKTSQHIVRNMSYFRSKEHYWHRFGFVNKNYWIRIIGEVTTSVSRNTV